VTVETSNPIITMNPRSSMAAMSAVLAIAGAASTHEPLPYGGWDGRKVRSIPREERDRRRARAKQAKASRKRNRA
jgi:hypothetical protein